MFSSPSSIITHEWHLISQPLMAWHSEHTGGTKHGSFLSAIFLFFFFGWGMMGGPKSKPIASERCSADHRIWIVLHLNPALLLNIWRQYNISFNCHLSQIDCLVSLFSSCLYFFLFDAHNPSQCNNVISTRECLLLHEHCCKHSAASCDVW